jgi:hypothetical protein
MPIFILSPPLKSVAIYQSDAVSARILLNKNDITYLYFEQQIALKNSVQTSGNKGKFTVYFLYFKGTTSKNISTFILTSKRAVIALSKIN